MLLCTAQQMRHLDKLAITNLGIPGIVLMENAGKGTVSAMRERYGDLTGKKVMIFVGPGNNGGDGLVIARHLHQLSSDVHLAMLVHPEQLKGDAAINMEIVNQLPIPRTVITDSDQFASLPGPWDIAVDALFGTGLKRPVEGLFSEAVQTMNSINAPVVAVDTPSGLDSDSGHLLGATVRADLTCSYGLAKFGQVQYPGRQHVGELRVIDIGIPPHLVEQAEVKGYYLNQTSAAAMLPQRPSESHKGSNGHVALVAGSTGKTGAAILASQGCLRAGAGLATLFVPSRLNTIFEISCPEAMTLPLAGLSGHALGVADWPEIEQGLAGKKAIMVGPGLGTAKETAELVNIMVSTSPLPMVLDADALNCLNLTSLTSRAEQPTILTPHPGEMARLILSSPPEVQNNRLLIAKEFACRHQVVLVLKGAATIIAAPDGRVAINATGNAGMASGGMGDVLAGIIAGLLSQGLSDWQAACLGVHLHGLAADLAQGREKSWGYLASDLTNHIPAAISQLTPPEN